MLARWIIHPCQGMTMLLLLLSVSESKRCVKREEIGNRVNNHYECNHPVYSECCEHGERFTCCQPPFPKNLREQLQLWGMVGTIMVVGAILYTCFTKDGDFIRSETLQQSLDEVTCPFCIRKKTNEKQREEKTIQTCDQACLTSNMVPPVATTSFIQHGYHL